MARERQPFSRPVLRKPVTVYSEYAKRMIRRDVTWRMMGALYRIDTIWRMIGDDEEIDKIEAVLGQTLARMSELMVTQQSELDAQCEENGITEIPDYTHREEIIVRVLSPQISQYVALVQRLDHMIRVYDALWLCGVVSNRKKKQFIRDWVSSFKELRRQIVSIERQTQELALKRGKALPPEDEAPDDEAPDEAAAAPRTAAAT